MDRVFDSAFASARRQCSRTLMSIWDSHRARMPDFWGSCNPANLGPTGTQPHPHPPFLLDPYCLFAPARERREEVIMSQGGRLGFASVGLHFYFPVSCLFRWIPPIEGPHEFIIVFQRLPCGACHTHCMIPCRAIACTSPRPALPS